MGASNICRATIAATAFFLELQNDRQNSLKLLSSSIQSNTRHLCQDQLQLQVDICCKSVLCTCFIRCYQILITGAASSTGLLQVGAGFVLAVGFSFAAYSAYSRYGESNILNLAF
jgi:hypothetical protein